MASTRFAVLPLLIALAGLSACGDRHVTAPTTDPSGHDTTGGNGNQSVDTVPPEITEFSPKRGGAGTVVDVAGKGFGRSKDSVIVRIGGTVVQLRSVAPGWITFIVPEGAVSGTIQITAAGKQTESGGRFTVPLSITSLSAMKGAPGSMVKIQGAGFGTEGAGELHVLFGERPATVTSRTPGELGVTVPPGAAGTASTIAVTVAGERAESALPFLMLPPYQRVEFTTSTFPAQTISMETDPDNTIRDTLPATIGFENMLDCGAPGCGSQSLDSIKIGWTRYTDDLYTGSQSSSIYFTIALDTARKICRNITYAYSGSNLSGGPTTGTKGENGGGGGGGFELRNVPYTLQPDGSILIEAHGAALEESLITLGTGSSRHWKQGPAYFSSSRSTAPLRPLPADGFIRIVVR